MPYGVYAARQAYYREAFIAAFAAVQHDRVYSVYVTNYQASSVGTTLLYFDTIISGTDYDVAAANQAVQTLFNMTDPSCAATAPAAAGGAGAAAAAACAP